jgi:cation diffusion facilitator CzcD-associated flavoprotein CzcO
VTRVAIVGAGFGGIAVAHRLRQTGFADLTIFEKAEDIGGVWRDNTYPGCACDIPAPLYSYSFALNPDWSRRFPPRGEILDYLRRCVTDFGLKPHLRLGVEVTAATWQDRMWTLTFADGETAQYDVLVAAVGQLSRPLVPVIPGAPDFTGPAMHTARWDPALDVSGLNVGLIGSGASAVQLAPVIAPIAARITVFQRTPPWTLPKPDRRYGRMRRALNRRAPQLMRVARAGTWSLTVVTGLAITGNRIARVVVGGLSRAQLRFQARGKALRKQVTPDYPIGCKRVVFSNDWFRTLRRPNVDLVTSAIERVTPNGVRTADGVEHPVDVLVYGTGFTASEILAPLRITGRAGVELSREWASGAYAYLGIAVPGFPNMFLMYGPNTNTGNTSVIYFHEAQARYIAQAVALAAARGPVEVRGDVAAAFDAEMQRRLSGSVWVSCDNWYRGQGGRVVTNWPGMASEYRRRTARLDDGDYAVA